MSWGIPDRDQTSVYADMAKARRIREGRDFDPAAYTGPRLTTVYNQHRDEARAAAEQAEAERIASLSPRELWLSTLPWEQRAHIAKWEQINRRDWPFNR